jgi:hypothetical protein
MDALWWAGIALMIALAGYAHVRYRTPKVWAALRLPVTTARQRWARGILVVGGVLLLGGIFSQPMPGSHPTVWRRRVPTICMLSGFLLAFPAAFAVGYTAKDGRRAKRRA